MKPELSALLDGELDSVDADGLLADLRDEESLRIAWSDYQLIGDALRREPGLGTDITAQVMGRLAGEPTVLVPQPRRAARWQRSLMALAASLAGVAVVGWMAFAPQERDALPPAALARLEPMPVKAVSAVVANASAGELREYLAAHQAHAGGLPFQGNAQQIRSVSLAVGE